MFSLIICSVKPQLAQALEENIRATIGVEAEVIVVDNRNTGKGIAEVYNEAARRARYPLLGFLHEDTRFHTPQWGPLLAEKLNEAQCGVVGFAGSTVKPAQVTGWYVGRPEKRTHFLESKGQGGVRRRQHNPRKESFSRVVTLDGMALFLRRDLWQELPFDEELLRGSFHGYDLDLTLSAHAKGYCNWVCHTVWLEHFSLGAFRMDWYKTLVQLHQKWQGVLPLQVEELSPRAQRRMEARIEAEAMRTLIRKRLFEACPREEVMAYLKRHPLSPRAWRLGWDFLRKQKK